MPYSPQTWHDLPTTDSPLSATRLGVMETGIQTAASNVLTPTATKTGAYSAVAGDLVVVDASSGPVTITLPAAAAGVFVAVRKGDSSVNAVTIAAAGTDTIGVVSPVSSVSLLLAGQVDTFVGVTGGWVPDSGRLTVTSLDLRYSKDDWLSFAATLPFPGVAASITSGNAFYARVTRGYARPATKIGFVVGTSSGNVSVAVYRNTGTGRSAAANNRVATSGAVACPSSGYAELTLDVSVDVVPGDWLALSADNATATFTSVAITTLTTPFAYRSNTSHPCPSTAGTATSVARMMELFAVP